jgi:hypothetical protein
MKIKHGIFIGFVVLLIAAMFTVAGCGDSGSGDPTTPPGGNPDGGSGSGWPNSSILSEYGLSGSAPTGATNITYGIATVGGHSLTIYFTGSSANDSPIDSWFISNGWTHDETLGDGTSIISYMYSKASFEQASYTRTGGTNCQIQAVKD